MKNLDDYERDNSVLGYGREAQALLVAQQTGTVSRHNNATTVHNVSIGKNKQQTAHTWRPTYTHARAAKRIAVLARV